MGSARIVQQTNRKNKKNDSLVTPVKICRCISFRRSETRAVELMVIAHLVSSEHTHRTHTNFAIFGQNVQV